MTIELLQTLSLAAYIAAAVLFLIAAALFFLLDVPKLYGDVSGRTARKAIETIRQQNESSGNKAYKPSAVNAARGKLTDRITQSGRLEPRGTASHISVGTEKFDTSMLMPQSNETAVLEVANETTLLTGELNDPGKTGVLTLEEPLAEAAVGSEFTVDVEMAFTGSSEIIE